MYNRKYNSIFIDLITHNWILEILGNDIYEGFKQLGYQCKKGTYDDYNDEDISFHMWWGNALPHHKAKVNAVFITHTDDKIKEEKLKKIKNDFDVYFCMSAEDAQFLIELGYDKTKVYGINLPVRNQYIRPLAIGIFSRCYPDKRKNEEWLFNYCKANPISKYVDFIFIGDGWGGFVNRLAELGCSFQWHNVSRDMPYEYMYQQQKLTCFDYYIYMGMDGGAMGSYDAYAMGTSLCISDDGYHKSIPDIDYSFSNEREFTTVLGKIIDKQVRKLDFFANNSVNNYVNKIEYIIEHKKYPDNMTMPKISYSVLNKRRSNYFERGYFYKLHDSISTIFHKWNQK